MSFDSLGWLRGTKVQFEVSDVFDSPVIRDGGVHACENDVNVDRLSCQDVVPLGIGEFRDTFGPEDHAFGCLEVKHMVLYQFPSKFLTGSKSCAVRIIVCEPGEE